MTENEKKLLEQMYAKVCEMDKRLEGMLDKVDGSLTSLENNVSDLTNESTGLKTTFQKGFADVNKGLSEIREIKGNRSTAKEWRKQRGQLN
ncbi:chromosome segregation protein SMC (plasmid) [Bacillus cereus]|uniref:chromosome segregation protein SMC n=1 Tax=Bacillus cereus TaxID=1396 RepID=UPI003BF4698C